MADQDESTLDELNDDFAEVDEPAAAPGVDVSQLATAIVGAVNAAQGPRKINAAEYQRTRSEHRDKPSLTRKFYQNGILVTKRQLSKDAIHLVNALRPGMYADGMFTIVPLRDGASGVAYDLRYENKDIDKRMAIKSRFPDLEHMLAAIVREQSVAA